jgi:hypothetical protein
MTMSEFLSLSRVAVNRDLMADSFIEKLPSLLRRVLNISS